MTGIWAYEPNANIGHETILESLSALHCREHGTGLISLFGARPEWVQISHACAFWWSKNPRVPRDNEGDGVHEK